VTHGNGRRREAECKNDRGHTRPRHQWQSAELLPMLATVLDAQELFVALAEVLVTTALIVVVPFTLELLIDAIVLLALLLLVALADVLVVTALIVVVPLTVEPSPMLAMVFLAVELLVALALVFVTTALMVVVPVTLVWPCCALATPDTDRTRAIPSRKRTDIIVVLLRKFGDAEWLLFSWHSLRASKRGAVIFVADLPKFLPPVEERARV
jgi:hypothetical protein